MFRVDAYRDDPTKPWWSTLCERVDTDDAVCALYGMPDGASGHLTLRSYSLLTVTPVEPA